MEIRLSKNCTNLVDKINLINMNKQQEKILKEVAKKELKGEEVLSGGSKYVNPIRKKKAKEGKKKSFWQKLFG